MRKNLFSITLILFSSFAFGNVRLPSVLASNMVLQQKATITLWGWADPGEKIAITSSWNNQTDTVLATGDANWKIKINMPAAGGPFTITFKASNIITLDNVMIGEVWICSGQSNMEWSSRQTIQQMKDELPHAANNNIRLFQISKTTSDNMQDDVAAQWKVCSSESADGFSAVGYFFGKKLEEVLHVPIGLIGSNWGGTSAEVWTPAKVINADSMLQQAAAKQAVYMWWPNMPGKAYNAMIYPLINFSISGVIWYQGESNVTTASTYSKLFSTMINAWRKDWQKDFPFYYVQIAPFNYNNKNVGALLREQQEKTLFTPNTGMVVISDLVDDVKNIHPLDKRDVGLRLANLALAETYNQNINAYKSPMFKNMEIDKNKAVVYFDNAPNGFVTKDGKSPAEFYIAGEDKNFLPAEVKMEKNRLIVFNKQIQKPVAVRFAFSNTAISNIFSKEGLPVAPFRTDDWEVQTTLINNQ